jgi:hypothetical protein
MIAALTFIDARPLADGRTLRQIAFVPRSTLPLSATCLVANGVRETLARLLATEVDVELVEPQVPGAAARRVLLAGASIVRVRGRQCDGYVVIRAADARRLAALAFGERERSEREPLSKIERTTLERVVAGLVPLCTTLCGTLGPFAPEPVARATADLATYFEVRTTGEPCIAIGFGLSRDPREEVAERITLEHLADVELAGRVEFAHGSLGAAAFSRLRAGAVVSLETPLGAPGVLRFGGVAFARVTCGAANGRSAIALAGDAA